MTITATFADSTTVTIMVDPWMVESAVDTFFEMDAIAVTTKED